MPKAEYYNLGTLIWDMGKIGVICRMIETGKLNTSNAMVNWRFNYEIYYVDGSITIMGHETLQRLIASGAVHLLEEEHVLEDQINEL
jgi:hypothetical protein|tara:strand:+ start:100 stop:360 length:261 start_codon:yes stop_codon:yes gene_type:complete